MKKIFFFFIWLPLLTSAQITDNFIDGDFTYAPAWHGNDTDFVINSNKQLQLNSSGTSESYLRITNTQSLSNCEWNFWISLNFSPSSGNYARVYLASNKSDLSSTLNGYYLQFGETGSGDQVELFRQSGTSSILICRGTTIIANAFSIGVQVTRDNTGLWRLFVDAAGGTNYTQEASGTDATYTSTSFFGVYCDYTSTNANGFFFDDFYIYSPPDATPALLDSIKIISQNKLDAYFSEALSAASAQTPANYSVNNNIGYAAAAAQDSINFKLVHLTFGDNFTNAEFYTLTVTGVQDPAGNNTINATNTFLFTRPLPNDLVINEILFDPHENGVEWIEIYNRSDRTIDLKDVFLCTVDNNGSFTEIKQIAPNGYLISPGNYRVLSTNGTAIRSEYNTSNPTGFIDMASLPSLNNDSDHVALIDISQTVIDKLRYNSDWHLPLLNNTKGISLERVNFESPTQDKNNWHSAAESVGDATPAYQNSQYTNGENGTELTIAPEIFSPDNDGYNDVLSISYSFDTPGMIGNVQIYDSRGRLEKTLVHNELLATSGTFFWDGMTDDKLKARLGIYILYIEAFDTNGNVKKYKRSCVLGGKF